MTGLGYVAALMAGLAAADGGAELRLARAPAPPPVEAELPRVPVPCQRGFMLMRAEADGAGAMPRDSRRGVRRPRCLHLVHG